MPPKPPQKPADPDETIEELPPDGATVVFDTSNSTVKRPGAVKLVVTKGPKSGSEFTLGPGETTIGRQADNTVVIPDISVSRRHVIVRKEGASWILADQGSGNGTLLNGARVEGEAPLNDGDVFAMGDTEVRFCGPPAARKPSAPPPRRPAPAPAGRPVPAGRPAPVSRPRPRPTLGDDDEGTGRFAPPAAAPRVIKKKGGSKKLLFLVGLAFVLVMGVLALSKQQQTKRAQEEEMARQQQERQGTIDQFNQKVEAGKAKARDGDFKGAAADFGQAVEFGKAEKIDVRDASRRLEAAKAEVASQETVEKAKDAVGRGELASAVELLKGVSEDSAYYQRLPQLKEDMKAKIPERLQAGKAALSERNFEKARQAVADVLAVDAENADAADLTKKIDAAGAPPAPKKTTVAPSEKDDGADKALDAFRAGKFDEAVSLAEGCSDPKCKPLAEKLAAVRDGCKDPENADTDKITGLLKSLGGTGLPCMAAVGGKAATKFVKQGIAAMGAEDLPKAFQAFRKSLELDPGNAVAEKHMRAIKEKAKSLFEQAYVDKGEDPEKARHEFETVISITAPDDELNAKAKRHIKSLTGN